MTQKFLIESGGNLYNVNNDAMNLSAMHIACMYGQLNIAQFLLETFGQSAFELRDGSGHIPLHTAVLVESTIEIARFCLESGGDLIDTTNTIGVSPLLQCAILADEDDANIEGVKLLLDYGANKEIADLNGWTPLFFAAFHGNVDMLDILISAGANVSATSIDGQTPLHVASATGILDVVKHIVEADAATLYSLDDCHRTPLDVAIEGEYEEIIRLLRLAM